MTKRQPNTLRSDEAEPPNSTKVHLRKAPIFLKNQTTLMTNWFHDGGSARSPVLVVFTLKICTINCQWTPWINAWKLAKPGRSLLLQNIPPENTKVAVNLKFSRAKNRSFSGLLSTIFLHSNYGIFAATLSCCKHMLLKSNNGGFYNNEWNGSYVYKRILSALGNDDCTSL